MIMIRLKHQEQKDEEEVNDVYIDEPVSDKSESTQPSSLGDIPDENYDEIEDEEVNNLIEQLQNNTSGVDKDALDN